MFYWQSEGSILINQANSEDDMCAMWRMKNDRLSSLCGTANICANKNMDFMRILSKQSFYFYMIWFSILQGRSSFPPQAFWHWCDIKCACVSFRHFWTNTHTPLWIRAYVHKCLQMLLLNKIITIIMYRIQWYVWDFNNLIQMTNLENGK